MCRRFSKVLPSADVQQGSQLVVGEDVDRLLGYRRGAHPFHRRPRDLAVLDQAWEQLLQRAVALGDAVAGKDPVGERRQEGLQVLSGDAAGGGGYPGLSEPHEQVVAYPPVGSG